MEPNCLEIIYDLHAKKGKTYKYYEEVKERVIGDVLMGKIKNNKLVSITPFVNQTILYFYETAQKMNEEIFFSGGCSYVVYRGIKNIKPNNNQIVQPIPFSTSLEKENAKNWASDDCCILNISVPVNTHFLCIDNPNEGKEIVLPAGIINIQKTTKIDNITEYDCVFDPSNTYEKMIELQIKHEY